MNAVKTILKILAVLAAIAGIVYVIATYGDKIVAWAKKLLQRDCISDSEDWDEDWDDEFCTPVSAEEAPVSEDAVASEAEPEADTQTVTASESDFEG